MKRTLTAALWLTLALLFASVASASVFAGAEQGLGSTGLQPSDDDTCDSDD